MLRTSKVISGVALVALLLCVGRLAVQAQNVLLPATTPAYYTIVTAGFGSFSFSLHYEEYGNSATEFTLSVGRYYSPTAVEYTDEINNRYYIEYLGQYQQCSSFYLDSVGGMRVMGGATEFLVELNQANVMFQNLGMTNAVRSQPSVHFNTALAWTSSTITPMYVEVDEFLREAYGTAGLPVSSNYAVSVSIDVYFASDTFGGILLAGAGSIPLRYSINGSFVDNVYGSKPINIVYDFMQFAALDIYTAAYALYVPWECSYTTPVNTSYPASIPTPPSTLPAPNTTLPTWTSGRAAFELTASNNPVMQIDALLKSAHGEELLIFLSNPSEYTFYSMLYLYDFADERDFNFAAGAVYTLNGTDANPYNEWNFDFTYRTCTGTTINPNTVSPIQWLNAASINRLYADPNFLRGAKPLGRVILADRAITTDAWQVVKTVAFNGAVYNFTLQLYVTTNGWLNLGRTTAPQAAQLIRLSYSGVKYPAKGLATIYSMQIDWYLQYIQAWNQYSDTWMPSNYGCTEVVTGLPVLPPLPPQYSVSVSEAWFDSSSSSQYTVYADTVKNVRRLDGRFTAPGGMAIVTPSPISPNYVSVVQWSQNVTLTQGFSGQMLSQAMPYLTYNSNQAPVCGAVTLSAFDFNGAETLNFFDWLGQADPSQALYIETKNIRGVDLDIYQVSITSENSGHFVVSTFQVYYLSIDETMTLTVPVMAEVSVQFYNFYWFGAPTAEYQFYNFRQSVPPGIFTSPTALSCTGIPALPVPVYTPPYYEDPSPQGDGTPTTAPTWPGVFSMLIEGQFFANNGDYNIYVARWYVDFNNFRERLDIEPAFSIAPVNGVNPISATYLYYYNNNGGTFAFNSGTLVTYNGSCSQTPITTANMNPLKRVPPGNLFDTFFPQTTAKMSQQSTYNSYSRYDWSRWDGVFYDEYDWNANTTFQGYKYSLTSSILISIPEWMNSAETGIYNFTRIPLAIQANGNILSLANKVVNQYSAVFRTAFYQPIQPGFAMFDAALLGCPTSQQSPWWNIYGDQRNGVPQSSSDSVSSSTIIGAVVGVVGGIFVVAMVATFVRRWKRGDTIFSKYPGGTKSNGNTHANDNELVGVGKVASDEAPENSLNRASLNNLVKEGNPLEVEVEVHDTNTDTAAPSNTNSSDH